MCFYVDINVRSGLIYQSAEDYVFQNHLFYYKILYTDYSSNISITDIIIKWDRIYSIIVFAVLGIYLLIKRKNRLK